MTWNKRAYQSLTCEGPLGFPMTEESARQLEALLTRQPGGREWEYQRGFAAKAASELFDDERSEISVITSAAVDHDREVVLPAGVDLTVFRKNPVVTFAHRYDQLPVGRALWIKQEHERIKAKTRYSTRPETWTGDWLPDAVWHMVQAGDLRGKSIGFLPIEGHAPHKDEIARRPELASVQWVYTRTLLLEYAVAPVQTNPEALVEAISKGVVSKELLNRLGLHASAGNGLDDGDLPPLTREARSLPAIVSEREYRSRIELAAAKTLRAQPMDALVHERFARALGRV